MKKSLRAEFCLPGSGKVWKMGKQMQQTAAVEVCVSDL